VRRTTGPGSVTLFCASRIVRWAEGVTAASAARRRRAAGPVTAMAMLARMTRIVWSTASVFSASWRCAGVPFLAIASRICGGRMQKIGRRSWHVHMVTLPVSQDTALRARRILARAREGVNRR
jgi:hypothetical protein